MPDGTIISGVPKGISQSDVLTRYNKIKAGPAALKQAAQPKQDDRRSASEVALDQIVKAGEGIPKAITGIPGFLADVGGAGWDIFTGKGTRQAMELLQGTVSPISTSLVGAAAYAAPESFQAPSREEWEQAATGAGANVGGILLGEGAGKGITKIASKIPKVSEGLYQESLKPGSRVNTTADIKARVRTGLKQGITIDEKGLGRLQGLVDQLNSSIEADIATDPNAPISPTDVSTRLVDARRAAQIQALPESDVSAVDAARTEWLRQHQIPGRPAVLPRATGLVDAQGNPIMTSGTPAVPARDIPIKAEEAQELKKGTYRQMSKKAYGEQQSGTVEAQKALARGLKEELEHIFPEIKSKNLAEGELIDLQPDLEAAVNRLGNKSTISRVLQILGDPAIKSRIAIALHRAGLPSSRISARLGMLGAAEGLEAGKPVQNRREAMERLGR